MHAHVPKVYKRACAYVYLNAHMYVFQNSSLERTFEKDADQGRRLLLRMPQVVWKQVMVIHLLIHMALAFKN